jgi:hypothetical protein
MKAAPPSAAPDHVAAATSTAARPSQWHIHLARLNFLGGLFLMGANVFWQVSSDPFTRYGGPVFAAMSFGTAFKVSATLEKVLTVVTGALFSLLMLFDWWHGPF